MRAVLAPRTVQEREDDVDLAERARRLRGFVDDEVGGVGALAQRDRSCTGVDAGQLAGR